MSLRRGCIAVVWRSVRSWMNTCGPALREENDMALHEHSEKCKEGFSLLSEYLNLGLNDANLKSVEITVLGSGSSLIGKSLKTEILREEALELAPEGFLPMSERGELPKEEKRSLFRELGLPYVADPAVTRHLNEFLEPTGQTPDAILFNGGFFIPEILRERVADVVGHWYGRRPEIFENSDLDLAVARGAAYYS